MIFIMFSNDDEKLNIIAGNHVNIRTRKRTLRAKTQDFQNIEMKSSV